ncbi:MAG: hypothetical protein JNJ54_28885 [Myxococcaceae bacterium]|nr:hypothetical protein [Myxococcaceae bacterium]
MTIRSVLVSSVVLAVFSACPVRPTTRDAGAGGGGLLTGGGFSGTGGGFSTGGGSTGGGSTGGGSTGGGSTGGGSTGGGSTGGGMATGGGSTGGGMATGGGSTGGGSAGDGGVCPNGFGWNGTDFSIAAAKCANICGDHLWIRDVVVTGVEESFTGTQGDSQAKFWVQDTRDNRQGLWISKSFTDLPRTWQPRVGDLLNIRGFYKSQFSTWDRFGYRRQLGNGCSAAVRNDGGVLEIEVVDGGVTSIPVTAMPGFGNAMNGTTRPNADLGSTRVFIPGPVSLTSPTPVPLSRLGVDAGVAGFNGFEITGGVLVNNIFTFGNYPDGGPRCDWRAIAADGGVVTFPNGLTGIWDTYTHAPCIGVADCGGNRDAGSVPFTTNTFTYVLYPTECAELQGMVQ